MVLTVLVPMVLTVPVPTVLTVPVPTVLTVLVPMVLTVLVPTVLTVPGPTVLAVLVPMVLTVLLLNVVTVLPKVVTVRQVRSVLLAAPLGLFAPLAPAPLAPFAPSAPLALRARPSVQPAAAPFDTEYARLKEGRAYSKAVPTGAMKKRHGAYPYWLVVPASYDPAKRWQVRFQLHGGVMRDDGSLRGDGTVRLAGDDQIYVMPAGWRDAPWWSDQQVASLRAILEDIKRDYNVDENRVFLSGISDGATGLYYIATHDTTPYAAFLPLNGYYLVLRSPDLELRSAIFLNNLRNKPLFIVNGGRDPLYPMDVVEPSIGHLDRGGVRITYVPQPEAGHDTSWWPDVKEAFERFTRAHPRVPLPDTLTWEVSDARTWNRAHWLVIDSLGSTPGEAKDLPDLNLSGNLPVFRNGRSGRVDLARSGNTITMKTRGVKELTLLLSPDQFDFDTNVTVVVNGRVAFDGRVEKSAATLAKWASRDNDRTMLFAAELRIKP